MHLVVAISGASGAYTAKLLVEKSPWQVSLVASKWGRKVYERECGLFAELEQKAAVVYEDSDLEAAISSGSVPTAGMVVTPCSCDMLARIANGMADTLITRAAHCHLKERRKLILCVRETPLTSIDIANASKLSAAGAIIMPISPPFYMFGERRPESITLAEALDAYTSRVLDLLGHPAETNWEHVL